MTANSCTLCNVPLMRDSRQLQEDHCVNCGRVYAADSSRVLHPGEQEPSDDEATPNGTTATPGAATRGAAPAAAAAAAVATEASAGPASAPPRPLAYTNGHGRPTANGIAGAASSSSDEEEGLLPPPPGRGLRSSAQAAADERIPSLLSERMLQGWALLETSCPRCATPLVRERRSGSMHCVSCDMRVVTEAQLPAARQLEPQQAAHLDGSLDVQPQRAAAAAGGPGTPRAARLQGVHTPLAAPAPVPRSSLDKSPSDASSAAAAAAAATPVAPASGRASVAASPGGPAAPRVPTAAGSDPASLRGQASEAAALAARPQAHAGAAAGPLPAGVSAQMPLRAALSAVHDTLLSKLHATRALLAVTPVADTERCRSQLALLGDLVRTLDLVQTAQDAQPGG